MNAAVKKQRPLSTDLDLKPFMNLMVVLIPMLLLSVEFARVAIIDIALPEDTGSMPDRKVTTPSADKSHLLRLTAIITDSVITLGAKGGFLPSIVYREFHRYVAKDDGTELVVEYAPEVPVRHPVSQRPMTLHERSDILLYLCDENRGIVNKLYTPFGEVVTDADGVAREHVAAGDTVYVLTLPRRRMVVDDPAIFTLKPFSVYDELFNRLMKIKERYHDAKDANEIIIAAENGVIYDKIVQIMDRARAANYPEISISKLRG